MAMLQLGRLPEGACFCACGKLWIILTPCCRGRVVAQSTAGGKTHFPANRLVLPSSQAVFLSAERSLETKEARDVHAAR